METYKFNSVHGKGATVHRNENILHSISNTHQMAKIITVAQWTAAAFLAESGFMYLIICGGMREKLHLGPTWHAPLTVKHIILSDIIFFSFGFDWHPVSIQTIQSYFVRHETGTVDELHT